MSKLSQKKIIAQIIKSGNKMANTFFHWSIKTEKLSNIDRNDMKNMQLEWDKIVKIYKEMIK